VLEKNISFVVQGPILKDSDPENGAYSTYEVLKSIRKFYPTAEIVLSTWKGADLTDLDYDKALLNDDPGAIIIPDIPNPYNHNRLIVSSRNGIEQATYEVVVKTRTDIVFVNNSILNAVTAITPVDATYAIFSHYIISTNYYVRNPYRLNLTFHASDIILIGKKADLLAFFSAPVVSHAEMINKNNHIRLVAEQYLTLNSIRTQKNKNYIFNRTDPTDVRYFMESEKYLFNSFIFLSMDELGVKFPKRLLHAFMPEANYSILETKILTRKYRENDGLDLYSYWRAGQYLQHRTKFYLKIKGYNLLQKMKRFNTQIK
jgi:hypothetical protein